MSKVNYSTVVDHTSDAGFRAWGSALSAAMQSAGLTVTSDTGQINWTTVTKPASNTAGGYEIYRFADTLQSTAPVFLKIEYGSSSTANTGALWITTGTATNGAGTLSGTGIARVQVSTTSGYASTTLPYPTYVCLKDGYLGVMWKLGCTVAAKVGAAFAVFRTSDDTGVDTGDGLTLMHTGGSTGTAPLTVATVSFLNSLVFTPSTQSCVVPGNVSSSTVSGVNFQAYKHFVIQPTVRPVAYILCNIAAEVAMGSTFTVAPISTTVRTYISAGTTLTGQSANTNANVGLSMLWE